MKKWLIFSFLTILLISGCNAWNDTRNNVNNTQVGNRDVPNNMYNPSPGSTGDITNQNPNFLNLRRADGGTTVSTQSIGADVNKARQTIALTKEFRPGSVWLNNAADEMNVTAYKKGPMTTMQRKAAEARLHRQLIAALPRYQFHVTVLEG